MDFLQNEFPNILPQISDILDRVNRQMLLILKTNDLIRGIEHTLRTNKRMGAFRVMSSCCVRSVYGEKLHHARSKLDKFSILLAQYWQLFKINVYYTMLNLGLVYGNIARSLKFGVGKSIVVRAES